jgi:PAS domain S-box-containing protein
MQRSDLMSIPSAVKSEHSYWVGLLLVLGFLGTTLLQLDRAESQRVRRLEEARTRNDLHLVRTLIKQAAEHQHVQEIADTLAEWGRIREDTLEVRLVADDGSVLARFQRQRPAEQTVQLSEKIPYGYGRSATLQLVQDIANLERYKQHRHLKTGILTLALVLSLTQLAWAGALRRRNRLDRRQREEARDRLQEQLDAATGKAGQLRAWLDGVLDSLPALLIGIDAQGRITEWSRSAEQTTHIKREDALGLPLPELMPHLGFQMERMREAIAAGRAVRTARLTTVAGGTLRYSDVVVHPLSWEAGGGALIRVEDTTQRVRFEQMMVQTEKLVSLGGLAAGVAHELNSPLSGVLQNTQNVLRRLSPELPANVQAAAATGVDLERLQRYLERRKVRDFLNLAREAADRASRIVTDMLAFSRRGSGALDRVAVEDLVETALRLASSDFELKKKLEFRRVEVVRDYGPGVPALRCDRTLMEQALLNLIKNAAQAMCQANTPVPRRIILRTRLDGQHLLLEVEDNGPGMNSEVRDRVFEPFFTTRASGQGTGLGLAVVHFIVTEQHQGSIEVRSQPGEGSLFCIRLPLAGDAEEGGQGFSHARISAHGNGTP